MSDELDKTMEFVVAANPAPLMEAMASVEARADQTGEHFDVMGRQIQQSIAAAAKSLESLAVAANQANQAMEKGAGQTAGALDLMMMSARSATQAIDQNSKATAASMMRLFEGLSASVSQIDGAARRAATSLESVSVAAKGVTQQETAAGVAGTTAMAGIARGAETATTATSGLAGVAQGLAVAFASLGLGAGFHELEDGLVHAVMTFGTFEKTLNQIRAITGGTADDMAKLRAEAILMGQQTQYSANEAAEGMARLAKDGFTTAEVISALPGVLSLAAAAGSSVDESARIAAGSLRGFGLQAEATGKIADVFARAVTSSGMGLTELGTTMKYVGPPASAAGQSLLDMTTNVALLGKAMINGSQAGTTIRETLIRLATPPKQAADELHKLGIAVTDVHGSMLPLNDIIDQFRDKTAAMADAEKLAAAEHIVGARALSGFMVLANAAPDAFEKMRDRLNETGASTEIAKTMMEGFSGSLKLATSSIETAEKVLGEELAPMATAVANAVQHTADAFSSLDPKIVLIAASTAVAATAFLGLATFLAGGVGAYALLGMAATAMAESQAAAAAVVVATAAAEAEATAAAAAAATAAVATAEAELAALNASYTAGAAARGAAQVALVAAEGDALVATVAAVEASLAAEVVAAEAAVAAASVAATGPILALLALAAPWVLGLAAIAGAVGLVVYEYTEHEQAAKHSEAAQKAVDAALIKTIQSAHDQGEELSSLVEEHDALTEKTTLTKAEQERLEVVSERLKKLFPQLAGAVDAAADSNLSMVPAVRTLTGALHDQEVQAYATAAALMNMAKFEMAGAQKERDNAATDLNAAERGGSLGGPVVDFVQTQLATSRLNAANAKLDAAQAYQDRIMKLKTQADRAHGIAAPGWDGASPFEAVSRGAAVAAGGKGKKAKKGRKAGAGGTKGEVSADNDARKAAEAEAAAELKIAEATAAKELAIKKSAYAAELQELQRQKATQLTTEVEYAEKAGQIGIQQAQTQADFDNAREASKIEAAEKRLAADQDAEAKARADGKLTVEQRGRLVREDKMKEAADVAAIAVLKQQAQATEVAGVASVRAAHAQADAQMLAAIQAQLAADVKLDNARQASVREVANLEGQHEEAAMGAYQARTAAAERVFAVETGNEKARYDLEKADIAASMANRSVKEAAQRQADELHIAITNRIADAHKKAADDAAAAWKAAGAGELADLAALAASPSWATLDKLIQDTFKDPTIAKSFGDSLDKAAKSLAGVKTSLGDVFAKIASNLPLVGAFVSALSSIKDHFDGAAAAEKAMEQGTKDTNIATETVQAQSSGDPARIKQAAIDALDNETQKKYEALTKQIADTVGMGFAEALPKSFADAVAAGGISGNQAAQDAFAALVASYTQARKDVVTPPKAEQKIVSLDEQIQLIDWKQDAGVIDDGSTQKINLLKAAISKGLEDAQAAQKAGDGKAYSDAWVEVEKANAALEKQKQLHLDIKEALKTETAGQKLTEQIALIDEEQAAGTIDDGSTQKVSAIKSAINKGLADIDAAKKAGGDGFEVAAAEQVQVDRMIEQLKVAEKAVADAKVTKKDDSLDLSAYNSGVEKLVGLQKELVAGHDRYGNQTSLIAQAQDEADVKRAEAIVAHNHYLEQQKTLSQDILDIEKQRAKDVQAILDQGLAVRAKTEFQVKTAEIAAINEKAAKETAAKNQALSDLTAKDALEQTNFQNEQTRLVALATQKTNANMLEQAQIMANVNAAASRLGIEQSINDAIKWRAAQGAATAFANGTNAAGGFTAGAEGPSIASGAPGGGGGGYTIVNSDGHISYGTNTGTQSTSAGTFSRPATDGSDGAVMDENGRSLLSFDSGGVVPGPQGAPVPATVHGGEIVANPAQQQTIWDVLSGKVAMPALSSRLDGLADLSGQVMGYAARIVSLLKTQPETPEPAPRLPGIVVVPTTEVTTTAPVVPGNTWVPPGPGLVGTPGGSQAFSGATGAQDGAGLERGIAAMLSGRMEAMRAADERFTAYVSRTAPVPGSRDLVDVSRAGSGNSTNTSSVTIAKVEIVVPQGTSEAQARDVLSKLAQNVRQMGGLRI